MAGIELKFLDWPTLGREVGELAKKNLKISESINIKKKCFLLSLRKCSLLLFFCVCSETPDPSDNFRAQGHVKEEGQSC